jgi:hypothetical protein
MNELLVQNLSFKIHIQRDIPYLYVQQYIWKKLLVNVEHDIVLEHDIALEDEFANCVDLNDRTANAGGDMFIDIELSREIRILPFPSAPIFSVFEISKLQDCVSFIHSMCLRLPENIAQQVCSRGMHANYTIIPRVYEQCPIDEDFGELRSRCAHLLVDMGLSCGGILIDIRSAFWAHCHLQLEFSEWQVAFVTDPTCKVYQGLVRELLLFPEIDQRIVTKIAAMMVHPSWHRESRATHARVES